MQANFKVKTKHSWSPGKVQENVYVVRAKVGKKLPSRLHPEGEEKFSEGLRPSSLSTQKIKNGAPKLFKNAHKSGANETYLPLEKQNRLSLTNESSPPHSPMNAPSKIPKILTRSD